MKQFNNDPSIWMHIDLNSCFATIEQQANPFLRGKPIAVAAYTTPRGCILAPSIEAKRYGVKTGMQVREGQTLCPKLIILPSDPPKYRFVNRELLKLLNQYSPSVSIRSIDEMLLNFSQTPFLHNSTQKSIDLDGTNKKLASIAREIKMRIKQEIGEWLTVSIGISTNPYLAKLAAGLHKPDGLDEINSKNILHILSNMHLVELPYIKDRNQIRLNRFGIKTPIDFYFASIQTLKSAFASINGYYWYLRLHGYAIDEIEWKRKTIGHSYALPKATNNKTEITQLLCKLVEKMGRRLRRNHLTTQGIHVACNFSDGTYWHHGHIFPQKMYASNDLLIAAQQIFLTTKIKPIRILAVSCFELEKNMYNQMALFYDEEKKRALTQAVDRINDRWGEFSIMPGSMISVQKQNKVLDRIAFGRVLDIDDVSIEKPPQFTNEPWEEDDQQYLKHTLSKS